MMTGLIRADQGQITLDGQDITHEPMYLRARRGLGYLAQEPSVFRKLTVEENVLAILEMLPLSDAERTARLEGVLEELTITHLRRQKAYQLSGGERRRLEITRALVTQPKFMLLDEPFAGVDPIAVHDIQTIVAGLRHRGIGVLITDHNVEQTLDIVDRAYIMFEGKVQVAGTVQRAGVRQPGGEPVLRPHPHGAPARATHARRMKTGLHQHAALRQELRINPRLYQAMDLLYMPLLDLQQHLKQELLGNPFLEMVEPEEETEVPLVDEAKAEKEKAETAGDDEPDWEKLLLDNGADGAPRDFSEAREYVDPVPVEAKDLSDYLKDQVQMLDLNPRQRLLADEFLGNIAEDGYLGAGLEDIVRGANQLLEEFAVESEIDVEVQPYTLTEAEEMLRVIQQLDPPGVGARDLRECLLLQLEDAKLTETLTYRSGEGSVRRPHRPPLERPGQALRALPHGGPGRGR